MKRTKSSAMALPLVLWCIAFLAGLVVLVAGAVGDWLTDEAHAERVFHARQMALSGIAIGLSPEVKPGDPLLNNGSKETEGYEVQISNESGKINPNYWVAKNNREIFLKLFGSWGAGGSLRDAAIDGLIDWIDADDFRSPAGAERGEYEAAGRPGFPPNRPLVNVHEMESIIGLGEVLAGHERWLDDFTIWHTGKINLQYAQEPVLSALTGLTPMQCRALFELRAGPDGIEGNEDDIKFDSIDEAAGLLGISGAPLAALESLFDVQGSVLRIESIGYCYGTQHRIVVIALANGGGKLMSWEEQ